MVATSYPGFKLIAKIENADSYQSCLWQQNSAHLATIFNRGVVSCSNRTGPQFVLTCVETSNVVTATTTFASPMQKDDGGIYQVRCFLDNFSEIIIAAIIIRVSGILRFRV